ncbi:toprim domain-containing protein [Desulforhopalus sp. IMCC35007]|uniref:toprim domain-containing protein n=1 Tax=Desulforhopalus sp. IMCC35007 TaxID=2569543 RepID=UPI0010AE66D9|nr:toprim domain-containing protein [Desulforhopalus sp. IMCC35007]TKB07444.1 hypothetical protein FCL48_17030 [Desulforhopalus sp. IMCC35007]
MSRAHEIAVFYGQGKEVKNGAGWLTFCTLHGNINTPALAVKDKDGGDVDVYCHAGCDFKKIKDQFRADGLLPEWKPGDNNKQEKKDWTPPPKKDEESFPWKMADNKKPESKEHIKKYLAGRAITIDPLPVCLRWNSYNDKNSGEQVNMIVAAASRPDDKKVYACQRLFIDTDDYTKTGAKMLGNCDGRGVWPNRKGDLYTVLISEGIETILSGIQATGKNGVATLSTSGMKNIILPDETEEIYILVDSDPIREKAAASMPGQRAAYILAQKFTASREGRKAFIISPDDTCFSDAPNKLDFNDLLKEDPTGESIRQRLSKAVKFEDLTWTPPEKTEDQEESENDLVVREIFNRYILLTSENKIIDTYGHDIKDSTMVERSFVLTHAGTHHIFMDEEGKRQIMPVAKYWLNSRDKKVASSLLYSPGSPMLFEGGDGRIYYNTFRMPYQRSPAMSVHELKERLGPWHKIMDTVFHEHKGYIEDWFSFSIQRPAERSGIMPVCISDPGLGKSLVMLIMSLVIGHQNFSNGKILDVTGLGKSGTQWSDWIFNKKLSCIEEIDPEGESGLSYKILDALKDIITNSTLPLNLKGGRNGTFPVYSNIIGFSNHSDCVKIPFGDRRMFIADSKEQTKLTSDEYKEIWDWTRDEQNIVAVYQYLINREISKDFIPGQAKMTNAKRDMQADGRSLMQTAFDIVLEQYPCDLITSGELQIAVSRALCHLEGNEETTPSHASRFNSDKQYNAILKSMTSLWGGGQRIRVQRLGQGKFHPTQIRVIRNKSDWASATSVDVKDAMNVDIPWKWITDDEEVPF